VRGSFAKDSLSIRGDSMRFSGWRILREGLTGNKGWQPHWRDAEPKAEYDAIIIGGGGHGLSTAYYLAKEHGMTNIAVLEKGYLGGGNVGRNTTIVRANYFLDGNSQFYSHSLKLWENLEQDLNYNVMLSQRGQLMLCHSDGQRDAYARRGNSIVGQGDDAELLDVEGVRKHAPFLDFENTRFPIYGGLLQRRAGTARHDAVAWGYARGASERGVDLIQQCEVTGIDIENGVVRGVQTTRGAIRAKKVGIVVAGRSGQVAAMAGMRLPIESHVLQAFVTEGLKPVIDNVIRACDGGGHDPDADDRQGEGLAQLGRDHGHDLRRLPHHRQDGHRGFVHKLRLVLRRVQSGAGVGQLVCAFDGHGNAPCPCC